MPVTISKRLEQIAACVGKGSRIADIGSDHAFLPVFLVQSGKVPYAVAGEVNNGPWETAVRQVKSAGLEKQIDVRLGDGLSVVNDGEVDTVCIAGMGGTLICSILERGLHRLASVQHLILQPNVAERNVREWLYKNDWELAGESILKEDGIIYEILSAKKGDKDRPYRKKPWSLEEWLELGPYLWESGSPVFLEKWESEKNKLSRILSGMKDIRSAEGLKQKQNLQERLKWMEEVTACLRKDKP